MLSFCLLVHLSHYEQSNSLTNESITLQSKPSSPKPSGIKTKVGTPPRRSMAPQATVRGISQILTFFSILTFIFSTNRKYITDFKMTSDFDVLWQQVHWRLRQPCSGKVFCSLLSQMDTSSSQILIYLSLEVN